RGHTGKEHIDGHWILSGLGRKAHVGGRAGGAACSTVLCRPPRRSSLPISISTTSCSLPGGHRSPVIMLAWQTVSRGTAAVDLAVMVAPSPSVKQRRATAREPVPA